MKFRGSFWPTSESGTNSRKVNAARLITGYFVVGLDSSNVGRLLVSESVSLYIHSVNNPAFEENYKTAGIALSLKSNLIFYSLH